MRAIYRILDANLNRAREALRVIEEYARFVLDDRPTTAEAKACRGELQRIAQLLPPDALLGARDTVGDVGTALTGEGERRRDDVGAVATAGCKRLSEALRAIEEYAKLLPDGGAAAGAAKQLRYRGYTLEQRLLDPGGRRGRLARVRLYVLLSSGLCRGEPLAVAEAALAGGAECIQLREKPGQSRLGERALLELARRLRALTERQGALLIVNDRPDLAMLCAADGVHVGQDDLPVAEVRRLIGPGRLVGVSTHSLAQARQAVADGADYIGVGPMFATATKDAGPIVGPGLLRDVLAEVELPAVAIGGISAGSVGQVVQAGGRAVAVSSAVVAADDPAASAAEIRRQLPG